MVYDNEAAAQYLYGGVDRMRANIATCQAAYAEASKRVDPQPDACEAVARSGPQAEAEVACRNVSRLAGRRVRAPVGNGRARRQPWLEP
jgi:hypothetical protein